MAGEDEPPRTEPSASEPESAPGSDLAEWDGMADIVERLQHPEPQPIATEQSDDDARWKLKYFIRSEFPEGFILKRKDGTKMPARWMLDDIVEESVTRTNADGQTYEDRVNFVIVRPLRDGPADQAAGDQMDAKGRFQKIPLGEFVHDRLAGWDWQRHRQAA